MKLQHFVAARLIFFFVLLQKITYIKAEAYVLLKFSALGYVVTSLRHVLISKTCFAFIVIPCIMKKNPYPSCSDVNSSCEQVDKAEPPL